MFVLQAERDYNSKSDLSKEKVVGDKVYILTPALILTLNFSL